MNNFIFDKNELGDYKLIAGVDEVGRGCLFGDVVAACVIMPLDNPITGVKDSKKLSEKKREQLFDLIIENSLAYGIASVDAKKIDTINIKQASRLAMKKAIISTINKEKDLVRADLYLIDAESVDLGINQKSIIHGDDLSYSIACASIIAKVFRDRMCKEWDAIYPNYFLAKNKGYGTKAHRDAILKNGITPLHRKSFLKKIMENN